MTGEPNEEAQAVCIKYKNHRGEIADRNIYPMSIEFKAAEWHPEPQWLLEAWDIDKSAERSFAVKDIIKWTPNDGE